MKNRTILKRLPLPQLLPALLALVLLAGCTKGLEEIREDETLEPDYVILNAGVSTFAAAADDPSTRGAAEYVIRRVRLYAFDGDKLDNMMYVDAPASGNTGTTSVRMKVRQTAAKTLYVIVNEPDDTAIQSRLALINNPAAFAELEYAMATYFTNSQKAFNADASAFGADKFCLPMSGKLVVNTMSNAEIPVSLPVTRSLARVDVMVQKNPDVTAVITIKPTTTLDLVNTRSGGFYFGERTASGQSSDLVNVDNAASGIDAGQVVPTGNVGNNDAAVRIFSFYTPERDCTANKLGFELKGVDYGGISKDYTVEIGNQDGNKLTRIERNKVHRIYCTFKVVIDVETQIFDWEDVSVVGDILGGTLAVDRSRVVMDFVPQNNSFSTQVNFAADGNVSFVGYVLKNPDGTDKSVTTDGSNLPSWLPAANITGLPNGTTQSGAISLTYVPVANAHPDVALRLKTGNITKDITIVYDNGVIPASGLQMAGWTVNLPEVGLLSAKRGNILPTGAADANWNNEQMQWASTGGYVPYVCPTGYGYGASNTTAIIMAFGSGAPAANKCRSLGAEWYLPSKDELVAVYKTKSYLGTSYSFGANYYWSSSKGYYLDYSWGVLFINGNTYDYYQTTTSSYVRCVRDL